MQRTYIRLAASFAFASLVLLPSAGAWAQTQIKPRVLLVVDNSGSMLQQMDTRTNNESTATNTGGDGSISYRDGLMTRDLTDTGFTLYQGYQSGTADCTPDGDEVYRGTQSRIYNAKLAVNNVINASGNVDWGLARYSSNVCAFASTAVTQVPLRCSGGSQQCFGTCVAGAAQDRLCQCNDETDCGADGSGRTICIAGICSRRADFLIDDSGNCAGGVASVPGSNNDKCVCNDDGHCSNDDPTPFCINFGTSTTVGSTVYTGVCGFNLNLCNFGTQGAYTYGNTDTRGGTCGNTEEVPVTTGGTCGTSAVVGSAGCASVQTCRPSAGCTQNSQCPSGNCTGGRCVCSNDGQCSALGELCVSSRCRPCRGGDAQCTPLTASGPVRACGCGSSSDCPSNYTCTSGRCVYNLACRSVGGDILVNPISQPSSAVLPWVDGVEDFRNNGSGQPLNPELRALGSTPLAGAARSAAAWYRSIKNASTPGCNPAVNPLCDPQLQCRPYVLVLLTDGQDSCEGGAGGSGSAGPVAGAHAFVAETVDGARQPNKVYVVGMAFDPADAPYLNSIALAGGTDAARLANSAAEIQAALGDIVADSVLVERCNGLDDDCNGACDEPFPDVALPGGTCSNGPRAARTCDNGAIPGTHCFATGSFVCSADQRSQVCSAATCSGAPGDPLCPTAETASGCNMIDDDCNGVVDDCTPFVAGSCCTSMCPTCNPTGVPQPETCNGCDDDCDGTADNNLTDTGVGCGSNVGICSPGTSFCCQEANPTPGMCTRDPVTESATHVNNNRLVCLGGQREQLEVCNGVDDNCNGQTDEITQSCYPFATGTPGQGICRAGTQACTTTPLPPGNPGCPPGWPAGKACPNPVATFGPCQNAQGPGTELCNGIDEDCDGTPDDNVTDVWVNTACCPTGNLSDCQNTGTGTRCMTGTFQCMMGAKTCVGGVAKSAEVCDGIDNDCDGTTDDVAGSGANCTGPGMVFTKGECRAQYQCVNGMTGPGPNGLTCVQVVGPMTEICNGKDDDCDDKIDETAAQDPTSPMMDPRIGVTGGAPCMPLVPPRDKPPCMPGITVCRNGQVACDGYVGPQPNLCDGISRDCTGMANTNGDCPTGFMCVNGNCVSPCRGGEFPCPGGFVCINGGCIPDECVKLNCPAGEICKVDSTGKATCVDPCMNVTCPQGFRCKQGACLDDTCRTFGCPAGQICIGNPATCQPDPCFGVDCPPPQFCNAQGMCEKPCTDVCPPGEVCLNGECVGDPCAGVKCNPGEVCAVVNGAGVCVQNMCGGGCETGFDCCGGTCRPSPCAGVVCPEGTECRPNTVCQAGCVLPSGGPTEKVVGAGGGGAGCSMGGAERPAAPGWLLLLLVALVPLRRRRAAEGR
jgi:hypothetical protein